MPAALTPDQRRLISLTRACRTEPRVRRPPLSLHEACARGDRDMVRAFLEAGVHVDTLGAYGASPLDIAASRGHVDIVVDLLLEGADAADWTARRRSASHAQELALGLVQLLLEADVPAEVLSEVLWQAAHHGNRPCITRLLHADVDPRIVVVRHDSSPLEAAQAAGHAEAVALLASRAAEAPSVAPVPSIHIHTTARAERPELDADSRRVSQAAEALALAQRIPIDFADELDEPYLSLAARAGLGEVVQTLLARGAEIDVRHPRFRSTPLIRAAEEGRQAVVELLVRRGAAVNVVDADGRAALHFAAERGDLESVLCLLEGGADPNLGPTRTALMRGAASGNLRVVEALLEAGADPTVVDDHGRRASFHCAGLDKAAMRKALARR